MLLLLAREATANLLTTRLLAYRLKNSTLRTTSNTLLPLRLTVVVVLMVATVLDRMRTRWVLCPTVVVLPCRS